MAASTNSPMVTSDMIRAAQETDLEQVLDLAEAKRRQYAEYQPTFHRPARNARDIHRPYLGAQIEDPDTIMLVDDENGTINGFLIAKTGPAPPVYDPGGHTTAIDDFVVREPRLWPTVGRALLEEARAQARARGATQVVVVCGPQDRPKREMLRSCNLSVASEWFTGSA